MRGVEAGPAVGATRTRSRDDRAATRPTLLGGWLVATIPAVAELAVGGYRIAGPSLWRDEAATISGSQRPVGAIWALTRHQDAVHGAYYLLMHAVIAVGGTSEAVLRMPSLAAMCLAAGLTAALGRRLALASDLPAPDAVGVVAGLLLAAVPLTTRYAQEARPYALTTLFAVLATYLLVRVAARTGSAGSGGSGGASGGASGAAPGRGVAAWWAGYTVALVLTGLFNLFAVLLAVGHGVSLFAARRARPTAPDQGAPDAAAPDQGVRVDRGVLARWLACCLVAAALLAPIAVFSAAQSAQLSWVARPDASTVATLVRDFSGSTWLIPVVLVLGWLGCVAGRGLRRGGGMTLAVVSLPWLVLPPALLIAGSLAHPVYVERYVMFCLPALSMLVAAGLAWLVRLTGQALDRRRPAGRRARRTLATALAAAVVAVMAAALAGPQVQIRQPGARADNLRAVAAVIARHERPGDAVLYLPWDAAVVAMAYPAPFLRLRDVGLGVTPVASATLRGLPASAAVLAGRLRGVTRVWTVGWAQPLPLGPATPADVAATRAVAGMRLIGRWRVSSVLLSLYAAG